MPKLKNFQKVSTGNDSKSVKLFMSLSVHNKLKSREKKEDCKKLLREKT